MERVKVSKIAKQIRGVSYKPEDLHDVLDDNSVTLLRANNIQDGKVDFEDVLYVDKSKVSQVQYLQKGDILVCASSGSKSIVGKAASIDFDGEYTFGAFCKVVRPIPDMIDYLGVYFQSQIYRDIISKAAMGANINNIRNEHIDNLEIPEKTSKEISSIIQRIKLLQYIIDRRNLELQKLDELVKARFVEMFGDFSNNSKNWKTILFNQCFDIASSKRILKSEWKSEGIPFLRVRDMVQLATMGKTDNEFFISEELYASLSDADGIPQRGDILVSATSTLGKCYVIGPGERYYFKDADVLRFRPKIDINSVFFMEQMKTDYIKEQIARTLGITTVAHFTIKAAKNISMRYPDIKIQNEFADFVRQVEKSKLFIQKSLEYIKILKRSLMQQYFG